MKKKNENNTKTPEKNKNINLSDNKQKILEIIAEAFLMGSSKSKTMQKIELKTGLSLSYYKYNELLEEVFNCWNSDRQNNIQTMRTIELKRIEVRESELWQAWEDAKRYSEDAKIDARIMAEIRKCSEQRSKLIGIISKPDKKENSREIQWNEIKNYGTDSKTN